MRFFRRNYLHNYRCHIDKTNHQLDSLFVYKIISVFQHIKRYTQKLYIISLVIGCFTVYNANQGYSQDATIIVGKVVDKFSKEPLPFVDVYFKSANIGASTDLDGMYRIDTRYATDSLTATFIGFTPVTVGIQKGVRRQVINFELENSSVIADEVVVSAKKQKYRKKGNPAVELIKKVMANKGENRLKGQPHYSYEKHETIELDLNNITDQFKERKLVKQLDFVFDYIDTSEVNGKLYLPLFIKETLADVYYRKSTDTEKTHRKAVKYTEFDDLIDDKSIDGITEVLYQDVDIYENRILILGSQFQSPLAKVGLNFYRYYIKDTISYKGDSVIVMNFIPKNKLTKGFTGEMYITHKDNYFVKKIKLGIINGISLNFVRDLMIDQEYERYGETFVLTKDQITVDYSLSENGLGFYGTKDVHYRNYSFEPPEDDSVFSGSDKVIDDKDAYSKDESYWSKNRIAELSESERDAYLMIDSLNNDPTFKRVKTGVKILTTGYIPAGPIDIGPIPTFFSSNDVEGSRIKLAAETSHSWNSKFRVGGYGAYGFRDEAFKYSMFGIYSFTPDFKANPRKYLYVEHSNDVNFPGVDLDFIKGDNVLLSFRRGIADKMIFNRFGLIQYVNEGGLFDWTLSLRRDNRRPHGNLELNFIENDIPQQLTNIHTAEAGIKIKFAPNEQFLQGRQYRTPVFTRFPVFTFSYNVGVKALGGEYNYHRVSLNMFKKFNLSVFGHTLFEVEAGKIFGDNLPFVLLELPRANQTFAYQLRAYNLMNFLEFATDQYIETNIQHFFAGFFTYRIPLIKKLKLREVVSAKLIWGKFTDANNPELNPQLPQFQLNEDGIPETYSLEGAPYVEVSAGLYNIFKVLRIDVVKRLTYLDNPNLPTLFGTKGMGIRARFKVDF